MRSVFPRGMDFEWMPSWNGVVSEIIFAVKRIWLRHGFRGEITAFVMK